MPSDMLGSPIYRVWISRAKRGCGKGSNSKWNVITYIECYIAYVPNADHQVPGAKHHSWEFRFRYGFSLTSKTKMFG